MIHHVNVQISDREQTRAWYEKVTNAVHSPPRGRSSSSRRHLGHFQSAMTSAGRGGAPTATDFI